MIRDEKRTIPSWLEPDTTPEIPANGLNGTEDTIASAYGQDDGLGAGPTSVVDDVDGSDAEFDAWLRESRQRPPVIQELSDFPSEPDHGSSTVLTRVLGPDAGTTRNRLRRFLARARRSARKER